MAKSTLLWGLTVLVIIILALVVFLVPKTEAETIEIGSILILTGEGSTWGTASKNGIDMAIEDVNIHWRSNARRLVANHQDSESDPQNAVNAFSYLVDFQGIDILIGTTWSHTGMAIAPLANEKGVLVISPSLGVREFNEGSKFLFNTWPHDELLSRALADLVFEKGHRRIALIGGKQIWIEDQTKAFKERFEELGGEIIVLVEPLIETVNLNTEALKIKEAKNLDGIVSTSTLYFMGVRMIKRINELGVDLPIYSISLDADIIVASEGSYDGMEFLTSLTPTDEFKQRYEEKYGKAIDIGSASAYDAVMLIAKAIEETGSEDPEMLQGYLNGIEGYHGVSGNLTSDGKGGFTKPFLAKKVIDGVAVDIII